MNEIFLKSSRFPKLIFSVQIRHNGIKIRFSAQRSHEAKG